MMKRCVSLLMGSLLALAGVAVIAPTAAQAVPCYYPGTIEFFNDESDSQPVTCLPGSAPRNQCADVAPNLTSFVVNGTAAQWKVSLVGNCTGSLGLIYANSQGYMTGVWNNNIESTYRLAVPTGKIVSTQLCQDVYTGKMVPC